MQGKLHQLSTFYNFCALLGEERDWSPIDPLSVKSAAVATIYIYIYIFFQFPFAPVSLQPQWSVPRKVYKIDWEATEWKPWNPLFAFKIEFSLLLLDIPSLCRILTLMRKVGISGSTISQQILLLVVSTFGAGMLLLLFFWWLLHARKTWSCSQVDCLLITQCNAPVVGWV